MAATFYVSRVLSDRPFRVEHVGYQFSDYPDWYETAVSREGMIMSALGDTLEAEGGLHDIRHGHWSEVMYIASSPETSWLDGGVAHVYRWYGEWCSPRIDRFVEWEEFVQLVREEVR